MRKIEKDRNGETVKWSSSQSDQSVRSVKEEMSDQHIFQDKPEEALIKAKSNQTVYRDENVSGIFKKGG